ncbi:hypothetical protein DFH06DRAFT_616509 [Mycena polygramma]|nr:hypothetical protein DFH06DRAFT_616509 [Mycena polygramma]
MDSDNEGHSDDDFTSDSSQDDPPSSGMFSGGQNFTVTGATLTNITNIHPPVSTGPSGVFMIRMENIDLEREIRLESGSGIVYRQRRMHSAKVEIHGRKSAATVAIYHGSGAKKRWRRDIADYTHPNLIRIRGAASLAGIYATVFHGDLLPLQHFLALYRRSPILTVYIYGCWNTEYRRIIICTRLGSICCNRATTQFGSVRRLAIFAWIWHPMKTNRRCLQTECAWIFQD